MSEYIGQFDGISLRNKGLESLDQIVLHEQNAKLGMLVATLAKVNIVLVGDPGGGKTTLGTDAYRLVEGIQPSDVAEIPSMADVTPKQLIGGRAESTQTVIDENGGKTETTTSVDIPAIISPTTKWIFANEINRTSPVAQNALLDAIEEGTITTTAGKQKLEGLQAAVATMNPGEAQQGVFKMTRAFASRFSLGVVMGDPNSMTELQTDSMIEMLANGWDPKPEGVKPIVTLEDLPAIRREIASMPIAQSTMNQHVIPTIKRLRAHLKEDEIREGIPRMTKQLAKISKTLAFLRGEKHGNYAGVTPDDISDAAGYMVMARWGILRPDVVENGPKAVRKVTGR